MTTPTHSATDALDRMDYLVSDVHLNEFVLRERMRGLIAEMRSAIGPAQPVTVSEEMVDAAIIARCETITRHYHDTNSGNVDRAAMRAALAAAIGRGGDGWIKCSDRMPDKAGRYLVASLDSDTEERIIDIYSFGPSERWRDGFFHVPGKVSLMQDVTHWQPLPEAPRGV